MAMTVMSLVTHPGDGGMYMDGFRRLLETHIEYLIDHPNTTITNIDPDVAWRHKGNLHGLLLTMGLSSDIHWLVMRMNGYYSPFEYDGEKRDLFIPERNTVNALLQRYRQRLTIL